jgi:hypothetical protein
MIFNILYAGGTEQEKTSSFFNLVEQQNTGMVQNYSKKLIYILEVLAHIPCIIVGEVINSSRRFSSDVEE